MSLDPTTISLLRNYIYSAKWEELIRILRLEADNVKPVPTKKEKPASRLDFSMLPMQVSAMKSAFNNKLNFIRTKLNKVLCKYCYQHPWELGYQVDLICGATLTRSQLRPNVYHVNFLASRDDVVTASSPHERKTLFFAEFWVSPFSYFSEDVQSKLKASICCPASTGRKQGYTSAIWRSFQRFCCHQRFIRSCMRGA